MKFMFKSYKSFKIKQLLKSKKHIYIYCSNTLKSGDFVTIKKKLAEEGFKSYRVSNSLIKKIFANSIYLNAVCLVNSNILLIYPKEKTTDLTSVNKILNINLKLFFLCLLYDKKFYSLEQLKKIPNLSYKQSFLNANYALSRHLTEFYFKLEAYRQKIIKSE